MSNLKITGIAVVEGKTTNKNLKSAAIINDKICYLNENFTYDSKTNKLLVRTKKERKQWKANSKKLAPRLIVLEINKHFVVIEYQLSAKTKIWKFKLFIKKPIIEYTCKKSAVAKLTAGRAENF